MASKARNFLAVVFMKVAKSVLQNYHYAAQVLNAVTRLRPAIKHLRGSLHSNLPPSRPPPPPPTSASITLAYVFLPLKILKLDFCEKPK